MGNSLIEGEDSTSQCLPRRQYLAHHRQRCNQAGRPGPLTNSDQAWLVSEQRDRYQAISYPAPPISARRIISDPGINSPLVLMRNGREVLVTGHASCVKGDDYEIQATATQSTTGALARGRIEGRCSGRTEQYEAPTWVYDEALFAPGPAQVCGLLITHTGGKVSDVFQWCRKEDVDLRATNAS